MLSLEKSHGALHSNGLMDDSVLSVLSVQQGNISIVSETFLPSLYVTIKCTDIENVSFDWESLVTLVLRTIQSKSQSVGLISIEAIQQLSQEN